jgi:type IV pilus assembly protein PilV
MGGLKLKNKGYSLIEVLIAMSILTVGILAVISMQSTAIKVQSRNKISATMQLINQEILEKIIANASDDQTILSYSGIKTNDSSTKPTTSPADNDFEYFKTLLAPYPGAWAEVNVTNTRPYPVKVIVHWKDGAINHKLEYGTYILPH